MDTVPLISVFLEGSFVIQTLLLCGLSVALVFVLRRFDCFRFCVIRTLSSVHLVSVFSRFDRSFLVLDKVRIHKAFLVGLHYFRKSTNTWVILKFVVFLTPRYFHF